MNIAAKKKLSHHLKSKESKSHLLSLCPLSKDLRKPIMGNFSTKFIVN